MRYLIYKKISETDFVQIKKRLENIEHLSSETMQKHSFFLNRRGYDEVLALDYITQNGFFMGNIGVTYDEERSSDKDIKFNFYALKAYDADKKRFFKKVELENLYSLEEVEKEVVTVFEKCIFIYDNLRKEDLIDIIDLK